MSDELLAGTRQPRESPKAIAACNDYLSMGGGRSLRDLYKKYTKTTKEQQRTNNDLPPTRTFRTIADWSSRYGWMKRVGLYTIRLTAERDEARRNAMLEGLALEHERVFELKELIDTLKNDLLDDDKKTDLAVVDRIRGILDDLAKETGGRVKKVEQRIEANMTWAERMAQSDEDGE